MEGKTIAAENDEAVVAADEALSHGDISGPYHSIQFLV
jgi:hypothetical protein